MHAKLSTFALYAPDVVQGGSVRLALVPSGKHFDGPDVGQGAVLPSW